ncbi:peptide chain release factor N(5)-glutamine methyltransferase [Balneatrix alpica]|uniref:peptide chain release factor N(5)-glutamine methyltransferase n=1 Tax=Balneatrix alpica TaxID=75684 RepID=UPI002739D396|nr:peptide chain release factor N(5)-glutamine methyltransferase [Balneatrix alpica]
MPSLAEALHWGTEQLQGGESPAVDARLLLQEAAQVAASRVFAFPEQTLTEADWLRYQHWISRRRQGEPVAYLLGWREFWSLPLEVAPCTLIPRPDTERLVEVALSLMLPEPHGAVLDLGTGTGAIALALASERPAWQVQGVDWQESAVALAQRNAERLNLPVRFYRSHWFDQVQGKFALIVSNPPYIDADDPHLQQGDVRFEPSTALVAAEQGLADLRALVEQAPGYLQQQGWLLLEHGWQQAGAVRALLQQAGFAQVQSWCDLAGHERVSGGCWHAGTY